MSRNFRSYTVSLSANQEQELNIPGVMYAVVDSVAEFEITFDESQRIKKASAGTGGRFESQYQRVKFLSETAQTITIVLGFGHFSDARTNINSVLNATIAPSDTILNPSDVTVSNTAVLLVAANENRKEVIIKTPSDAENSIRIGSNTVTASAGLEVEPGSTIVLSVESAVYAIRAGFADVSVSLIDLERA